jgi:hypothetical protein
MASQQWQTCRLPYPAMFQAAVVEGRVVFEVHTDSTGRPEFSTFVIRESTNDL